MTYQCQHLCLPRVAGAVLFGRQPELIGSRCSRLAYGVMASIKVDTCALTTSVKPDWCPENEQYWYPNKFFQYVSHGQAISTAECVCKPFTPISRSQTSVLFELWATGNNKAAFTAEGNMHKVGCIGRICTPLCMCTEPTSIL